MGCSKIPLSILFSLILAPILQSNAAKAPAIVAAPSPVPEPLSFIGILEKGSQYKTFIKLLNVTQVGVQVVNQLEDSVEGLTVLAPTDNAFNSLKPGTLNKLNNQEQQELVMYHILPKYYTFITFETSSNPVATQATSEDGVCTVNITSSSNQANISTGVVDTSITNALYADFPLAVYSVDKVLLPLDLYGPNAGKPHHSPSSNAGTNKSNSTDSASAPSSEADTTTDTTSTSGVGFERKSIVHLGTLVAGAVLFSVITNLF